MAARPLFKLFIELQLRGMKEVERDLSTLEKKGLAADKQWSEFVDKRLPKDSKKIKKELDGFVTSFEKLAKASEKWIKTVEDGSKKIDKALKPVSKTLDGLTTKFEKLEKLSKDGLNFKVNVDDQEVKDKLNPLFDLERDNEINFTVNLKGGEEAVGTLEDVRDLRDDLNANGVNLVFGNTGADALRGELDALRQDRDDLNAVEIAPQADTSGVDQLGVSFDDLETSTARAGDGLDNIDRRMDAVADNMARGLSSSDDFGDSLERTGDTATRVAGAIAGAGGGDNSVAGSIRVMDADARAARALPTLLGDTFHQLQQFQSLMAAVQATVIPGLIAGLGAAGSAIGVLATGAAALATGLSVGLAGAAGQVGSAMAAAGAAVYGVSTATKATISNVLGLGKGFGSLQNEAKFAGTQVKAFEDLVAAMPAGTDAATHAQERLSQAIFYQQSVVREQIRWWNEYGAAAVELGGNFQQLRFDLFQIVSDMSGKMIPILNDFVEIAQQHVPAVEKSFQMLANGVDMGTMRLRDFLNSAQGIGVVEQMILAVGKAAEPTFNILSNGAILALQALEPMIPAGQRILENLSKLTTEAAAFAQSAEGIQRISDAWALADRYAAQLGRSVLNLVVAVGNLGQAFIQSGLVGKMMSGFESMTQAVRDFTASAQDADSKFGQFLAAADPILTSIGAALAEIVRQALEVVYQITTMRDSSSDLLIMEEIFYAIRDAAAELGPLLISAFGQLGPIIADLIPELAELARIFLDAAVELQVFLSAVELLISAFNTLPNPIQEVIGRLTALSLLFGGPGGLIGLATAFASAIQGWLILKNVQAIAAGSAAGMTTLSGALTAAASSAGAFMAAIAPMLAITAIVITAAVTFDYASANEAYNAAIENGRSSGAAWAEYFKAGIKGIPILGTIAEELDAALGQFAPAGEEAGQSYAESFTQRITDDRGLLGAIRSWFENQDVNSVAYDSGSQMAESYSSGVESGAPEAEAAGSTVSGAANKGLASEDGSVVGHAHGAAFADGVVDESGAATYAGETVSQAAADALQALEEASAAGTGTGQAYADAIAAGATPAQAAAAETTGAATTEYAKMPQNISQALQGMTPEMLAQFHNAHASAANSTAEFASTVSHNYTAVNNNIAVALAPIAETVASAFSDAEAAASAGGEAVSAAIDAALSVIAENVVAPAVDAWVAEIDRFGTDGEASATTGGEAIVAALDSMSTSAQESITAMVDAILAEFDRLNSESDGRFSELTTIVTDHLTTLQAEAVQLVTDTVDQTLAEWDRLNSESDSSWSSLVETLVGHATDLYEQVVGGSIFPDTVDESVSEWERLNAESAPLWVMLGNGISEAATTIRANVLNVFSDMATQAISVFGRLASGAVQAMQRAKAALLDNSPVPDIANGVLDYFTWMKDGTVEVTEDTVKALMRMWNALPDDIRWALEETAHEIRDYLGVSMFEDLTLITNQGMEDFQNNIAPAAEQVTSPILDAFNSLPEETRAELNTLGQAIADHYGMEVSGAEDFADEYHGTILDAFNSLPEDARTELGSLGRAIADEFGLMVSGAEEQAAPLEQAVTDPLTQATQQVPEQFDAMGNRINSSMNTLGQTVGSAVSGIQDTMQTGFQGASQYAIAELANIMSAVQRLLSFMGITRGNGLPQGLSEGRRPSTAPAPSKMARGGVAEPQPAVGGVSSGVAPRVVYGEQQRNVKEAYIVEDRPDNLPYLQEAASWYDMGLYPLEGMARGGVKKGRKGPKSGRAPRFSDRRRREKKNGRKHRGGGRGEGRAGSAGGSMTRSSQSDSTGGVTQSETVDSSTGASGTSPSTSAFPSSCGDLYPVTSPTPSEQQPYTDAALQTSGLTAVPATSGADHVNAPPNATGDASGCGVQASGSPPSTPWPSNSMMPSGSSPTSTQPYDSCGPSFAMAQGGVLGADGAQARPLESGTAPLPTWDQFLGYSWYGDPSQDWPELLPPEGWDPTAVYGPAQSPPNGSAGMASGGVLKDGVRYFEGGGLNAAQLQAGLDAGNSILGMPYVYGDAGVSGADCSGTWQYIYEAVAYGSPTPGPRYMGTYAFAAGVEGMTPGTIPGAMNVQVDLTGWEGDGTHMSGDIMNTPFESTVPAGVHNGNSVAGSDGAWTMGDPAEIASQTPPVGTGMPYGSGDPSGLLTQEVADWWNCQTAPAMDAAPAYGTPVNPWDSALPGMTQDYLTDVGQGTLGAAGYGGAPTGSTPQDWIVAALNGMGMDADQASIDTIYSLMMQESGGDPNAYNASGASGLMQMMPETFAAYTQGGDIWDPVSNIMASIAYQMAKYGSLIDFSPYAMGGFAMGPTMALSGENGAEFFANIEDRQASAMARRALGTEGITEGMAALASRMDAIDATLHLQMDVMPRATGEQVGVGVVRMAERPQFQRHLVKGRDHHDRRAVKAGVR